MGYVTKVSLKGAELQEAVENAVQEFVGLGKEFSAYNITQAIRTEVGVLVDVKHDLVKEIVHDEMRTVVEDLPIYTVEERSVGNNGSQVYLFYRPKFKADAESANGENSDEVEKLKAELAKARNAAVLVINNTANASETVVKFPKVRVNSSFVKYIQYTGAVNGSGELKVFLSDGIQTREYPYENVPYTTYEEFLEAQSKGQFYNKFKETYKSSLSA